MTETAGTEDTTENQPMTEEDMLRLSIWVHQRSDDKHHPEDIAFQDTIAWFFQKAMTDQLKKMGFTREHSAYHTQEACKAFGNHLLKFRAGLNLSEWYDRDWNPEWYDEEELNRELEEEGE